jgi:LuxR family maltose regulon positive regulatory protein
MVTKSPEEIDQTLQFVDGGIHSLADYLLTEVLASQPERIQDQLFTTSVLDRFCANLIEALFEAKGENGSEEFGAALIEWLTKSNQFIIPLDNDGKWFRYHHMFQDFLLIELKKRKTPQQIEEINLRASLWFEQNNFITEAIIHEDKAGDHDRIVRIISDHWEDIIDRDQWVIVENWISYLSESLIDQSPGVLIAQVWIAQRSHKLELVPALIEKITNVKFELTDAQSGHLSFARCMLYYFINEPKLALDEANNALKLLPITHKSYRADTYSWWTFAMMMNGFSEQAMEQYQENLKNIKPKGEPIQSTRIMMHPAFLAITQADIPSMIKYNENFFGIQNISPYMMGWGLYIKAMICWWSYDLENCQKIFEEFLEYRYLSASTCAIDIYICLARLHSDLGNIDEARKAIRAGNNFANKIQDQAAMDTMASGNAVLNLSNNELKDAEKWLVATEAVPLNPTMFFWSEIPSITRVKVLITKGGKENINKALNLLEEYKDFSESIYNRLRIIDILVLQSLGHKKLGDNDNAIINLKKAVELSSNGQWIRPFAEQHVEISDLLLRLKDDGVHPNFIDTIFESIPTSKKATESRAPKEPLNPLTPSELKVLQCIAEGLRNKEIAEKLFNSEETIKKHIYNMFQKLYVKNRLSLITKAKELGILA